MNSRNVASSDAARAGAALPLAAIAQRAAGHARNAIAAARCEGNRIIEPLVPSDRGFATAPANRRLKSTPG